MVSVLAFLTLILENYTLSMNTGAAPEPLIGVWEISFSEKPTFPDSPAGGWRRRMSLSAIFHQIGEVVFL